MWSAFLFRVIGQADLEFLSSRDPPTSAPWLARDHRYPRLPRRLLDLAVPNHRVLSSLLLALFTWYPCCSNILPLSGQSILCMPQIPASLLTVQPLSLSTKHISSWYSLSPLSFCKGLALGHSPSSNSPGPSTRDDLTQSAAPAAGASPACSRFCVRHQLITVSQAFFRPGLSSI